MAETDSCLIDFSGYYSALETVSLMNCQGYVVRVSGSTVESAGPVIGLGEFVRHPCPRWTADSGRGGRLP